MASISRGHPRWTTRGCTTRRLPDKLRRPDPAMRLNAYLARAGRGLAPRADELIKAGRVTVNGEAGQLNTFVESRDRVEVDGAQGRAAAARLRSPAQAGRRRDDGARPARTSDRRASSSTTRRASFLSAASTPTRPARSCSRTTAARAPARAPAATASRRRTTWRSTATRARRSFAGSARAWSSTTAGPHRRARGGWPQPARARAPRGPQAPGEADVRRGRAARHAPAPPALRGLELGDLPPGEWRELTQAEVERLRAATHTRSRPE